MSGQLKTGFLLEAFCQIIVFHSDGVRRQHHHHTIFNKNYTHIKWKQGKVPERDEILLSEQCSTEEKKAENFPSRKQVLSRELNIFRGRLNCKHSTIIEIESTSSGVPRYSIPYRSASNSCTMFRGKIIQTFNQPISTE